MSEDHQPCVRGCMRPCREDECIAGAECEHDTRIRATVGLLCDRCSTRLLQAIDQLPDLWAQLPSLYDTNAGTALGEKISRSSRTGSPALIRLDVMVLQGIGESYEGDGVMPVQRTIDGWLLIIDEELGLRPAGHTMTQTCTMLRTWHQRIITQPWADEYWADILGIWRALRHTTGAPGPIARCWGRIANRPYGGCGWLLYPPPPGRQTVTCPRPECGRTYTGPELIKLSIQGEREGVA